MRIRTTCISSSRFSKVILFVLVVFSVSFTHVYADVDSIKSFFPTVEHLSPQWKMSDFKIQNNVDVENSDETTNVTAKAYLIEDQKTPNSNMMVTLSLFEFESPHIAEQMQERISEDFFATQENSIEIQIDGFENCLGSVVNLDAENEMSYLSCVEGSFVILSNAVQEGYVYEDGNKLTTSRTSSAFATFVIHQLPEEYVVPQWIKQNAGWWADGTIDDESFISGIEFLIKEGIIAVNVHGSFDSSDSKIPQWIKQNAGWWADGTIDDESFISGIEFLIENGIISV